MSRLFICGITSNEYEKINDLIQKTKEYVDGYVWCVDSNSNSDSTYQLLEDNKKDGKIVRHPWVCAHDWQANEWLHCGIFTHQDWILLVDSSETPTETWLKNIRYHISQLESEKIGMLYCSGRPYLFRFQDVLFFQFTPHWMIQGNWDYKSISFPEDKKHEIIINKRNLNPDKHYQEHDSKYYLYARSNQIDMFYGNYGQDIVNRHEAFRRLFRNYLRNNFGEPGLNSLNKLFSLNPKEWVDSDFVIDMVEMEFCLSEYYQRTVLGMNFMGVRPENPIGMHPRFCWSFKDFLKFGDGWHDKEYKSTIVKYNEKFNIK